MEEDRENMLVGLLYEILIREKRSLVFQGRNDVCDVWLFQGLFQGRNYAYGRTALNGGSPTLRESGGRLRESGVKRLRESGVGCCENKED